MDSSKSHIRECFLENLVDRLLNQKICAVFILLFVENHLLLLIINMLKEMLLFVLARKQHISKRKNFYFLILLSCSSENCYINKLILEVYYGLFANFKFAFKFHVAWKGNCAKQELTVVSQIGCWTEMVNSLPGLLLSYFKKFILWRSRKLWQHFAEIVCMLISFFLRRRSVRFWINKNNYFPVMYSMLFFTFINFKCNCFTKKQLFAVFWK